MALNEKFATIKLRWLVFLGWLRQSQERFAIACVIAGTFFLCLLLAFIPVTHVHSEEHEHGDEEGHHSNTVDIEDSVLQKSGIEIIEAQSAKITPFVLLRGELVANANHAMNVKPRFGGIVKAVYKDFGDKVHKGETLLLIETATTRSTYTVRSIVDGIVVDKRGVAGSYIPENESILRVVDPSTVWMQGKIPLRDALQVKQGFTASVKDRVLGASGQGSVLYVSPIVEEDNQACDVRIELKNDTGVWRIGSFAEAQIFLYSVDVAVAVKTEALQDLNGVQVVFVRDAGHLIAKPVVVGKSDQVFTEIVSGMAAGEKYVAHNSFLAKAELLKATAEHEH